MKNAEADDLEIRLTAARSLAEGQASLHNARLYGQALAAEIVDPLEALNNLIYVIQQDPQSVQAIKDYATLAQKQLHIINRVAGHLLAIERD